MNVRNQGLISPYSSFFAAFFRATDVFIIISTLFMTSWILGVTWHAFFTIAGSVAIVIYITTAELTGLYGSWRFSYIRQEIQQVLLTWLGVVFVLLILAYATKTSSIYSRRVLLTWMMLTPVCLSLLRIILRNLLHKLREQERNTKSVLIVGAGEQGSRLAQEIHRLHWLGLRIVGYFDDLKDKDTRPLKEYDEKIIGSTEQVVAYVNEHTIDMVFIALHMTQESRIKRLVDALGDTTAQTYVVPDLFISELLHTRWGYIGNLPVLGIHDRPFKDLDGLLKRVQDIILSSLILCIIALPMLLIALTIKLTSTGPILFKQKRYGIAGEEISVWKFRTMNVCEDGEHIQQAQKNDVRVTWFGRFLRKTSLDELPQFINVLNGTMSIVGPRPHAVAHNEQYRKEIDGYMLRHTIKPGITGWAQVNGWRGETDTLDKMEKRIDHDLWYIRNWSLWLDIKIIFMTILYGFISEKTY
jgi:undecaprenyl-phosphate glucose phosphotransferase